mgnify:CR=1 FL=1
MFWVVRQVSTSVTSRFLIGAANSGIGANNFARGLNAAFDDLLIDECFILEKLGKLKQIIRELNNINDNYILLNCALYA